MAKSRNSKTSNSSGSRKQSAKQAAKPSVAAQSPKSFSKARDFVTANASMQKAGFALAGAGLLAVVSTEAGRKLLRTATDAVVAMISSNSGSTADQETTPAAKQTKSQSRSQRGSQARL